MKSAAQQKESTRPELFLRIKHPNIRPAAITEALGIDPEHAVEAGPAESRAGVQRVHSESYWLGRLESKAHTAALLGLRVAEPGVMPILSKEKLLELGDATPLDICILDALQTLHEKKLFLRELRRGGSIALLLQRADLSIPLTLNTSLARLAELGIALEID